MFRGSFFLYTMIQMRHPTHLLLLLIALLAACAPAAPPVNGCPEISRALAFLDARRSPALGLLNEAPTAAPNTYWLTNDNALAAYAYQRMGRPAASAEITAAILRYGQPTSGLIEVLWGEEIEFPPAAAETIDLARAGENQIRQEQHTSGPRFEDWAEYADLGFYGALNAFHRGRAAEAREIYAAAMSLYNGAGFRDKAFTAEAGYETYKLALALYAGAQIRAENPPGSAAAAEIRAAMLAMQRPDGGFTTHYRDLTHPTGDANTETTALALLALLEGCQ